MTTTKRKTPPKGDVRPETLAQFGRILDDIAEREVGFAKTVNTLYVVRTQLGRLKDARAEVFAHVKRAYEIGHRGLGGTPYELRQTAPGPITAYRAVESAVCKKANVAAWRRAQAVVPFVQIKAPSSVVVPDAVQVPDASGFMDPMTAAVTHREHPAWAVGKQLRERERYLLTRLEEIGAEFDWPGDLKVFSDGWSAQLTREQFSSDRLAEVDREVFDALAVMKVRQTPPRIYVARRDDDADGADGGADVFGD